MFGWLKDAGAGNEQTLSNMLVEQLRSEIADLRAQRAIDQVELGYLRRSLVGLADKRALAEIEFYREVNNGPKPATAPARLQPIIPPTPRDMGVAWAQGLYGDGHLDESCDEPPPIDADPDQLDAELSERAIEEASDARERQRIEQLS